MRRAAATAVGAAPFARPGASLGGIDASAAGVLLAAAADVALVLDADGIILDVAFADRDLADLVERDWIGRAWADTATIESRPKIEDLLRDASSQAPSRWRQINYAAAEGPDVPVRFATVRIGSDRRVVALGRELRAMASLQQRLAEAQQGVEREYARIRNAEKRYRLLFQLAAEAVLIVDAGNERIAEANPAAAALLGVEPRKLVGQNLAELFSEGTRPAARSFLAAARVAPRVDNVQVDLPGGGSVLLSGSLFRQDNAALFLVLLARPGSGPASGEGVDEAALRLLEALPEAFVTLDGERRILTANPAFLDLVQITAQRHVRGENIERWIGRPGVDIDLLYANLRAHGSVRSFSTVARGEFGADEDIEIAAAAIPDGGRERVALTIRAVSWRAGRERLGGRELPKTVDQFIDLVGRVPLKNLVRETTDLIERLCIEAALQLTKDNRASAAEMLGLSRQGLYAKLRRYGLGDLDSADDGER